MSADHVINTTMLNFGPVFNIRRDPNLTNITLDHDTADQHTLMRWIVYNMDVYVIPIIITVGIIGNIISFLVFLMTPIRALSSSVYLAALSVSDNGFLLCVFGGWLVNVNFSFYEHQGLCQLFIYLTYVFGFLSVWYVVAFTVERYVAVCFPFRRNEMCTTRRAKFVVTGLAILALLAYNPMLWTSTVDSEVDTDDPFCHVVKEYERLVEVLNYIDTVVTLIVPSAAIITINIRIVHHVISMQTRGKEMLTIMPSNSSTIGNSDTQRYFSDRRAGQNAQITRLLLVVSTMFLVLNLPSHVLRFHLFIMQFVDPNNQPSINYQQWKIVFQHIYYLNFCINFVLYSLCGRNFRKALRLLCSCRSDSGRLSNHRSIYRDQESSGRRDRICKSSSISERAAMEADTNRDNLAMTETTLCDRDRFICLERNNFTPRLL